MGGPTNITSNGGGLKLIGSDHFYIEYYPDGYDSTQSTPVDKGRIGKYIGYPGANDNKLRIHNNIAEIVIDSAHGTKVTGRLSVGKAVTLASTLNVGSELSVGKAVTLASTLNVGGIKCWKSSYIRLLSSMLVIV